MNLSPKPWVAIAAIAIVAYTYAAPGGHGGGSPMGGMGHADMGMHGPPVESTHAPGQGSSPTQLLSQNTKLAANLQKLLPTGMTAQQACDGFKNLGSCVAAMHVAHNLDIPFTDLKPKITGSGAQSLGKAIHTLRPDADAKGEARKAEGEARADLRTAQL
jgi:hypothetical protein